MKYAEYLEMRKNDIVRRQAKKQTRRQQLRWVPIPKLPTENERRRRAAIIYELFQISNTIYDYEYGYETPWRPSDIYEFVDGYFGERRWNLDEICNISEINKFLNYEENLSPDRFSDWLRK